MIRPEVIRKRLHKLDEYLTILHSLRQYSFEAFMADPERYGSAERFLHLAIETVIDLGNHVVADEGLGVVNCYSDIPRILAEEGYVTTTQAHKWTRMIGFRNVLLHEYVDIDRHIVYEVLQQGLADLEELQRVFAQWL